MRILITAVPATDERFMLVRAWGDGVPVHFESATLGSVVATRNKLCDYWSSRPDVESVTAPAIVYPAAHCERGLV